MKNKMLLIIMCHVCCPYQKVSPHNRSTAILLLRGFECFYYEDYGAPIMRTVLA